MLCQAGTSEAYYFVGGDGLLPDLHHHCADCLGGSRVLHGVQVPQLGELPQEHGQTGEINLEKEEGERRERLRVCREARETQIARLGMELCEGGESEGSNFSEDKEVNIRSVKLEKVENTMEEEPEESEAEMAEDEEIETESLDREAVWDLLERDGDRHGEDCGADADIESIGHGGEDGLDSISVRMAANDKDDDYDVEDDNGETMEEDGEESYATTDYGSLQIANEDFETFENLDLDAYGKYRWELLFNSSGVEHYVMKQLEWLRTLQMNQLVWNEIREMMNIHKSVQIGDPEVRKRAINYLLGRRRYEFWDRMGRIAPGETQEESMLPDEWAAIHYGWGHSTCDEQPRDPGYESSWSATDRGESEEEVEVEVETAAEDPVVTEIPDVTVGNSTD